MLDGKMTSVADKAELEKKLKAWQAHFKEAKEGWNSWPSTFVSMALDIYRRDDKLIDKAAKESGFILYGKKDELRGTVRFFHPTVLARPFNDQYERIVNNSN